MAQRLEYTKEQTVFYNYRLGVDWLASNNGKDFDVRVIWDETKTTLISASFFGRISSGSTNTVTNILMNDQVLIFGNFQYQAGQVENTIDVTALLRNGLNRFKIQIWKPVYFPTAIEAIFTGVLTITFEGEEPTITPPTTPIPDWVWWLIGGGAIVIVGVILFKKLK